LFIAGQLSEGAHGTDFGLSPRERQVIALLVAGYTCKESGRKIGIREPTVRKRLRDLITKLGVANRLELVLFALHHRLVDPA